MKKRVLSLLLCFVLAAGLLSVCAPPAQAGTIAGVVEQFLNQPDQIKKLFGKEVAHGDCGPAENEASVHYKIYEVTNPTVVQDNPSCSRSGRSTTTARTRSITACTSTATARWRTTGSRVRKPPGCVMSRA